MKCNCGGEVTVANDLALCDRCGYAAQVALSTPGALDVILDFEHSYRRRYEVKRIRQFFDRLKARVRRYG